MYDCGIKRTIITIKFLHLRNHSSEKRIHHFNQPESIKRYKQSSFLFGVINKIMGNCSSNKSDDCIIHNTAECKQTTTKGTSRESDTGSYNSLNKSNNHDINNKYDQVDDSIHVLIQHSIDDAKKHGTNVSGYRPSFDASSLAVQQQQQVDASCKRGPEKTIDKKNKNKDDLDEKRRHYNHHEIGQNSMQTALHPATTGAAIHPETGAAIHPERGADVYRETGAATTQLMPSHGGGLKPSPSKITINDSDSIVLTDSIRRILYHTSHHCDTIDRRDTMDMIAMDEAAMPYKNHMTQVEKQPHRPNDFNQYPCYGSRQQLQQRVIIVSEEP